MVGLPRSEGAVHGSRDVGAADEGDGPEALADARQQRVARGWVKRPRDRASEAVRVERVGRGVPQPAEGAICEQQVASQQGDGKNV